MTLDEIIIDIQKLFRTFGFKAEGPKISKHKDRFNEAYIDVVFDDEMPSGIASFDQVKVSVSAKVHVEDNGEPNLKYYIKMNYDYVHGNHGRNGVTRNAFYDKGELKLQVVR